MYAINTPDHETHARLKIMFYEWASVTGVIIRDGSMWRHNGVFWQKNALCRISRVFRVLVPGAVQCMYISA